jgi:excisionase family DNA binding protein
MSTKRNKPAAPAVVAPPPVQPIILTPDEVAARLKVAKKTVYEMTRSRARHPLPVHKAGKFLRFDWNEIVVWFAEQRKQQAVQA